MSDLMYSKTAGNTADVQEKLKLFPEVHMYKRENDRREGRSGTAFAAGRQKQTKRPQQTRHPKQREDGREDRKLERAFIGIIVFLVLVLGGELVFHFIVSPKLMIQKVRVRTGANLLLSDADVLRLAELEGEQFYFSVNPEEISERLGSYPLIKEALVEKKFPDTLRIDLIGREPLAMSIVDTGDGAVPVVFDEEGIVFQIGTSVRDMNALVISGIVFKNIQLGMQLPREMHGLLQDLQKLKDNSPRLFSLISEVKIVKRSSNQYEALLYFSEYKMPVRTGMSLGEKELKYILMVLDVVTIEDLQKRILELDLRSGEVVYKMKEVASGE